MTQSKKNRKNYRKSVLVGGLLALSIIALPVVGVASIGMGMLVSMAAAGTGVEITAMIVAGSFIVGGLATTAGSVYSAVRIFKKLSKPKFSFLSAGASAVATLAVAGGLTAMALDKGEKHRPIMEPLSEKFQEVCTDKKPGDVIYNKAKEVVYICPPIPPKSALNKGYN